VFKADPNMQPGDCTGMARVRFRVRAIIKTQLAGSKIV